MSKEYIAYYRVSTREQGDSGLGLSAQEESVKRFVSGKGVIATQFTEVESGKRDNRVELHKAIEMCESTGATLIIAKLDRLSRDSVFILTLKNSGVDFICADMPDANSLTIGIMAILAEDEAKRISDRTKSALKVIKDKISSGEKHVSRNGNEVTRLGNPDNLTQSARMKGAEAMRRKADEDLNNKRAGQLIVTLRDSGDSFYKIKGVLNSSGFVTSKGNPFSEVQVKRVYDRFKK